MANKLENEYLISSLALCGNRSEELSLNPCRGFRLEFSMSVDNGNDVWSMYDERCVYDPSKGQKAIDKMEELLKEYTNDSPRISQIYFYLTKYNDKDLDDKAFKNISQLFKKCRELRITVALRIAYIAIANDFSQDCVSLEQMKRHMQQLKQILKENRDVLFCIEGGVMGEWGEQSEQSSWVKNGLAGEIMDSVVDMAPKGVWVLARYASIRNMASLENQKRIGFHNDYIVGVSHGWDSGTEWSSKEYKNLVKWSNDTLVEGEMPWGWATPFELSGLNVIKYLKANHLTALSCLHNNHEGGKSYDLIKWRKVNLRKSELINNGLPFYSEWFNNSEGEEINRSVYEYIRDYLGYLLVVSSVKIKLYKDKINAIFSVKNYGFAAPIAMKEFSLALIDENGKEKESKRICDVMDLKPGLDLCFSVNLVIPDYDNKYRLGLRLESFNNEGAKLANRFPMINGFNILGYINFKL